LIRINKYLSLCGVTSRRGAETLIAERRVTLNDETIEKVGTIIDEDRDIVKVDGVKVSVVRQKIYVLLNKPGHVMTTLHDPFKRKTISDLLNDLEYRIYPVGRLDYDTRGVLILTNDGELAYRLAHPRYRIKRIYEARVLGRFTPEAGKIIEKGIKLEDGAVGRAEVEILQYGQNWTRLRLTLFEGRKREVKQLCKKVGYPVRQLYRKEFAGITVSGLSNGKWRHLRTGEVTMLKKLVGLSNQSNLTQ